jgi:hypothetical protein
MRFLLEPDGVDAERPLEAARAAHAAGLDGVLLAAGEALPAPLVTAAFVAASVPDILIAAELPIGDRHPLEVAEEALVADQASGGRLIVVACPAPGAEDAYDEALDLIRVATVARPFRFAGERWTVPARLPENSDAHDELVRVTPAPAGVRLELWCAGVPVAVAADRGLGHLAEAPVANGVVAAAVPAVSEPRARRERWTGAAQLVEGLRAGRAEVGQDWSVVVAPLAAVAAIGAEVRPRVQLDRLPDGLERHWDSV